MRAALAKMETRQWIVIENAGLQLFGVLHRPNEIENPPIVVILHGFASSKLGSNRCYVTLAESLAKNGIAAFRFDFRGSGDSEGSLSQMTLEDFVSDAVCVLDNMHLIEGIDATRMALFGTSLGGSIALLAAQHASHLNLKAMALWSPVASGELWYRDFIRQHPEHSCVDPGKILTSYRGIQLHPEFRLQFGAMAAHRILPQLMSLPILHMHGEKDQTISIAHQEAFRNMCGSHPHVRFIKYPEAEHSLGYSSHFANVLDESISWYRHYL